MISFNNYYANYLRNSYTEDRNISNTWVIKCYDNKEDKKIVKENYRSQYGTRRVYR